MAENLNYATAEGSWCYDNQVSYCETYGRLYNWATASTACPSGWHLPANDEWTTLTNYISHASTAGAKLKATSGWNNRSDGSSGNGTDEFGFSALPGGYYDAYFYDAGGNGYWWSSSERNSNGGDRFIYAYIRYILYGADFAYSREEEKYHGFSVRCLQN
jgi:uncharacterized protein (TIGR02145 family)